jgi:hypothetical protein
MDDRELDAALADVGGSIAWPQAPDVRVRVLARIQEPRRVAWWRTAVWSPRYGFAPAIVTMALVLIAVLVFSPEARATATDILRLRGVEIFRGPVPTPSPSPTRSPGSIATPTPIPPLTLGERVTLDQARARAGYAIVVPTDPLLGAPDEVWVRSVTSATAVSLVYTVRDGIPVSAEAGISALVTEIRGATVDENFFGKVIDRDTILKKVTVNGQPGFWIQGKPHFFFYNAGNSQFQQESLRLAGNTLLWLRGDLLLRLEAQVDEATALRIASTFR